MSPEKETDAPLRSVHTASFPEALRDLGISLVVSTYQAGKVVLLRNQDGRLNTHFRDFSRPMGLAADRDRLAVGTPWQVSLYRNVPALSRRLEPPGRHDACYLPRATQVTGDIDAHEMAWAGTDLWVVNTRFSCLVTLDGQHSFVPRWRPRFVTALAPDDRCHLNGLALADGRPRYVTAHSQTDTPEGWREHKLAGGCIMDVERSETILAGLVMPHSPRIHAGRLWFLESGTGSLAVADPAAGRFETVARLPGFTRGLDFAGPLAFVGLSQVRESATFSGVPIAESRQERRCGVWMVDVRSGQVLGYLQFEDAVQEVFAVVVLPGVRCPELLTDDETLIRTTYVLPDAALAEVPPERRE